jgi:hypothetical protein
VSVHDPPLFRGPPLLHFELPKLLCFDFYADLDLALDFDANPEPTLHCDGDPGPDTASQNDADPDPQHCFYILSSLQTNVDN